MNILQVSGLSKRYGEGDTSVTALDGVSFSVERGEFVAIVGPSGSGKSTLMHLLGGVDKPSAGRVVIGGTDIYALGESQLAVFRRRNIGIVYQFYNLIPTLNVEENITLPLLLDGRRASAQRLGEILETTGLGDRVGHLPSQLSGGQQQRVSIGRALIAEPSIILADEPTGNLDSHMGREIMETLKYSNRHFGQTLVMITHDENVALQADRIIAVEDGRITRDEVIRS